MCHNRICCHSVDSYQAIEGIIMKKLNLNIQDTEKTVIERIFENGQKYPERSAVICDDEEVSYSHLCGMIFSVAEFLRERGIAAGDKVAVQSWHNKYCIAAYYAVHLIEAVLVPLEKNAPEARMIEIARETDCRMLISRKQLDHPGYVSYEEIFAAADRLLPYEYEELHFPDIDSACEMVFTTGTTGKSKGVLITHRNMSWYCYAVADAVQMKEENRFFITTPLNHAGGLRRTHLSLANACTVVYLDGLINMKKYFAMIEKYQVTSLYLPPVAIRLLINTTKDELLKYKDQIDFVYSSSSPLPAGDCEALRKMLPDTRLYNAYEASETPGVSLYDYNTDDLLKGCMGKANKGVELAVLKDDDMICKDVDVQGQICIKSPMNMKCYYNAEEVTASVMKDGWYVSSDLGHFDAQGNIYYDGRRGDVINIGGYKISPMDVEEAALLYDDIKECICIQGENKQGMPILKLLAVPKNEAFDSKKLISLISSKLEPYKVPKIVEVIDEVHKTFNGKIDRKFYRNNK